MRHHPTTTRPTRHDSRSGFTLTELLVVVGILLLLIGLSVVLIGRTFGTAREAATRGTLEKVNALVRDRMEALDRSITKGELLAQVRVLEPKWGGSTELARIEVRKNAFKSAFPQTFAETGGQVAPTDPTAHDPKTESSEVLYWVLTNGSTYGFESVGSDYFTANEVKDTDGDGLLEFVDAWEQPLRFYRWPTRLIRPGGGAVDLTAAELLIDGLNTSIAGSDPDDPKGKLTSLINETNFHTPNTYHAPLLVSAGADDELGLYEPYDTASGGHLAQPTGNNEALFDNHTNRKRLGNE